MRQDINYLCNDIEMVQSRHNELVKKGLVLHSYPFYNLQSALFQNPAHNPALFLQGNRAKAHSLVHEQDEKISLLKAKMIKVLVSQVFAIII